MKYRTQFKEFYFFNVNFRYNFERYTSTIQEQLLDIIIFNYRTDLNIILGKFTLT
jgi:hypothetical protein